jgi:hypothetical protein
MLHPRLQLIGFPYVSRICKRAADGRVGGRRSIAQSFQITPPITQSPIAKSSTNHPIAYRKIFNAHVTLTGSVCRRRGESISFLIRSSDS